MAAAGGNRKARRHARSSKAPSVEVTIGPSEKMSKSKKNVVAPETIIDGLRRRYHPLVHAVGYPARTRHRMDGSRRRRLLAFRAAHLASGDRKRKSRRARHRESKRPKARTSNCARPPIAPSPRSPMIWPPCVSTARSPASMNSPTPSARNDAADGAVRREALETLVLLIGPMMPHLAESAWESLGHKIAGDRNAVARKPMRH